MTPTVPLIWITHSALVDNSLQQTYGPFTHL